MLLRVLMFSLADKLESSALSSLFDSCAHTRHTTPMHTGAYRPHAYLCICSVDAPLSMAFHHDTSWADRCMHAKNRNTVLNCLTADPTYGGSSVQGGPRPMLRCHLRRMHIATCARYHCLGLHTCTSLTSTCLSALCAFACSLSMTSLLGSVLAI